MTWVKKRPLLTLLEVAWRWIVGVPVLWYGWQLIQHVDATTQWSATGIADLSINKLLTDPMSGSEVIARFLLVVWPAVAASLMKAVPLFLFYWVVVSALGRTLVLKRMGEGSMKARPLTLLLLNVLRLVPTLLSIFVWWKALDWIAQRTILLPQSQGGEPQVMAYVGSAIVLTMGLFVAWALVSWVFGIAPLLAMLRNLNLWQSLAAALRIGKLRGRLIEINLVMGVVKIALLVLLMVFSATPLPFQSIATGDFLMKWTLAVGVLYFIASDFFHVARLAAYLHLWQDEQISR